MKGHGITLRNAEIAQEKTKTKQYQFRPIGMQTLRHETGVWCLQCMARECGTILQTQILELQTLYVLEIDT